MGRRCSGGFELFNEVKKREVLNTIITFSIYILEFNSSNLK